MVIAARAPATPPAIAAACDPEVEEWPPSCDVVGALVEVVVVVLCTGRSLYGVKRAQENVRKRDALQARLEQCNGVQAHAALRSLDASRVIAA